MIISLSLAVFIIPIILIIPVVTIMIVSSVPLILSSVDPAGPSGRIIVWIACLSIVWITVRRIGAGIRISLGVASIGVRIG